MAMDDVTGRYTGGIPDVPSRPYVPGHPLTLHLGVIDQPYRNSGKKARPVTTGDVAGFLEKRYALMETFYKVHEEDVSKALEGSLGGAFEALLMGRVVDPWGSATSQITSLFRQFISSGEAERVGIPGTPTKAALRGISHRLKRPYRNSNPRRVSFRDTGMYVGSSASWVTSD